MELIKATDNQMKISFLKGDIAREQEKIEKNREQYQEIADKINRSKKKIIEIQKKIKELKGEKEENKEAEEFCERIFNIIKKGD